MKKPTIGIALIIIGIMMMAYTGFNLITTKKIIDLGPIEITKEKSHPIEWSPWVGLSLCVAGILIFVQAKRKS